MGYTDFISKSLLEPNLLKTFKHPVGQIEIDWSNPLTKGLVYCGIITPRGLINLVNRDTTCTLNGTGFYTNKAEGSVYRASGAASSSLDQNAFNTSGKLTITSIIIPESSGTFGRLLADDKGGAGGQAVQLLLLASGYTVYFRIQDGATWYGGTFSDLQLTLNKRSIVTGVYDGSTLYTYANKVKSTTTYSHTGSANNVTSLYTGTRDTTSNGWTGWYLAGFLHNRALSDAEVIALQRNPYQILKPATIIPFPTAAAGATGKSNPLSGPVGGPLAGPIG